MNPISKALADAKWKIPLDILQQTFAPTSLYGRVTALNIDSVIRDKVIDARVRADCDLVGGTQLDIPLDRLRPEQVELPSGVPYTWALIYQIPMVLSQNRPITRVLALQNTVAPIAGSFAYSTFNSSALANAALGVMRSQAPIEGMSTARVDLIGPNTIMVADGNQWPSNATLRCYVANDTDMTTLPPGAYPKFSKLCELAIKAYIHNTLILKVNSAELQNGQELGRFKEIVDSYADSNTLYEEYLEGTWKEVAAYSDPMTARDWFRLPLGAGV